ncbi:hypothetical protein EVAR_85997_1 [Eumeta japonica]|uniref:Uncharacterized protein n=1 Tax=Eumeta variegata TaxID=151549 RepID=A0A4C1UJA0_EUMVA|nr:hypothetical protein EVAR_85997_1 [Eumeta japonica]
MKRRKRRYRVRGRGTAKAEARESVNNPIVIVSSTAFSVSNRAIPNRLPLQEISATARRRRAEPEPTRRELN